MINDELLDHVAIVESGNNPNAVSPKGAVSAYGIMPQYVTQPGYGIPPITEEDLKDPVKARKYTQDTLETHFRRLDNDLDAALVSYNAGPSVADKWIAAGKDPSMLPEETRNYLKKYDKFRGQPVAEQPTAEDEPSVDELLASFDEPSVDELLASFDEPSVDELLASFDKPTPMSAADANRAGLLEETSTTEEILRAVIGGLRDGTQQTMDTINNIAFAVDPLQLFRTKEENAAIRAENPMPQLPKVPENESTLGKGGRAFTQFIPGLVAGGPIVGSVLKGTGTAANIARSVAQGAVGEQLAFDPQEQRLSNFIRDNVDNPTVKEAMDVLAADPGDGEAISRLKMAAEGAGIALPLEGVFRAVSKIFRGKGSQGGAASGDDVAETTLTKENQAKEPVDNFKYYRPTPEPGKFDKVTGKPKYANSINLERINSSDEVHNLIMETADAIPKQPKQTHAATQQMAEALGMSVENMMKTGRADLLSAETIHATREVFMRTIKDVFTISNDIQLLKKQHGPDADITLEAKAALAKALAQHRLVEAHVAGIATDAGRALNAFKIRVGSGAERREFLKKIDENGDMDKAAAMIAAAGKDPAKISKAIAKAHEKTFGAKSYELWYNYSMLSALDTLTVNLAGNVISQTVHAALELPLQLAIGKVRQGIGKIAGKPLDASELLETNEVLGRLQGVTRGFSDAIKLGKQAFDDELVTPRYGKSEATEQTARRAIEGQKGRVVRLPNRFMMGTDVFFKVLADRQMLYQFAHRAATKELRAGNLSMGKDYDGFVKAYAENPPKNADKLAREHADIMTFQNDTDLSRSLNRIRSTFGPVGRVFFPFTRAPSNLLLWALDRTPGLNLYASATREALMKGSGADFDKILSRSIVGGSMVAGGMMLAHQGLITGAPPIDRSERLEWEQAGNRPFSWKMPDGRWQSYSRGDPIATPIGTGATLVYVSKLIDQIPPNERNIMTAYMEAVTAGMLHSVAQNFLEKSYLKSFKDMVEVIFSSEGSVGSKASTWFSKLVGNAAVGNIVARSAEALDPYKRDTKSGDGFYSDLASVMLSRIPLASKTLPYSRDRFGEPIKKDALPYMLVPFRVSPNQEDPKKGEILTLLDKLNVGYKPVARSIDVQGGHPIKLNSKQYEALSSLSGHWFHRKANEYYGDVVEPELAKQPYDKWTPETRIKHQLVFRQLEAQARNDAKVEFLFLEFGKDDKMRNKWLHSVLNKWQNHKSD